MSVTIDELYFGATAIRLAQGAPLDHLESGLYVSANSRGIMAAGLPADIRRAAGSDVERELRAQGPLLIGEAYVTLAGDLAVQGVQAIAHGVVASDPGASSALDVSARAMLAGLRLLEEAGCHSVTVPQASWRIANLDQDSAASELARVTITHLRRLSRLQRVVLVSRDGDYLGSLNAALEAQLRGVEPRVDGNAAR